MILSAIETVEFFMHAGRPQQSLTEESAVDGAHEGASGWRSTVMTLGPGDVVAVAADGAHIGLPEWVATDLRAEAPRSALGHQARVVLLMIEVGRVVPADFIRALADTDDARAVVVCGPAGEQEWRSKALVAGATGCVSPNTPAEDQRTVFVTAVNYSVERDHGRRVRQQSEQLCFELASVIGSTSEELLAAKDTARRVHSSLEDLRNRIVRIFV